ncbi:MAG: hypothetical protein AB9879_01605 [Methanothrix sp.]
MDNGIRRPVLLGCGPGRRGCLPRVRSSVASRSAGRLAGPPWTATSRLLFSDNYFLRSILVALSQIFVLSSINST